MLLVAGNMLPVSRQHNIPLYLATDVQQTGNNFVMLPWCKRGFTPLYRNENNYSLQLLMLLEDV